MKHWTNYSVPKASEGGVSQKFVRSGANSMGFNVKFYKSIYFGHYAFVIDTKDKRKLKKFEKEILY